MRGAAFFYRAGQDGAKKFFSQGGAGQEKTCAGRGAHLKSKLYDTLVQIKDLKSSNERFKVLIPLIWTQIVPPSCS